MQNHSIGIILLAAGESSRLGKPKQLLQFRGETLLRRSVKFARSVSESVFVVLGAHYAILEKEIEDLSVEIVENRDWKSGMSSSIKSGLSGLIEKNSSINGVLLMVCDQPFVDERLLLEIINKFTENDCLIAACAYQNTLGVPAIFHSKLFSELFALDSPKGAGILIKKHRTQVEKVSFPSGAFDIDTAEDYDSLLREI